MLNEAGFVIGREYGDDAHGSGFFGAGLFVQDGVNFIHGVPGTGTSGQP